jgi:hypothetical protein
VNRARRAEVSLEGFDLIVVCGGVVSPPLPPTATVNVRLAGEASGFPAGSVARTLKV